MSLRGREGSLPPVPMGSTSARPGARGRVLVADDEPSVRRSLARLLMAHGFEALTAEDGDAALALLATTSADVLLADLTMPGMGGMELFARAKQQRPDVEVIVTAGTGEIEAAVAAVRAGAYDMLVKPFVAEDVVPLAVGRAIERRALARRARSLEERIEQHESFGEIVGQSTAMQEAHRLALASAKASAPVLILGESGTGKDLFARAIHRHGNRSDKPLRVLSCGALPEDALLAELFGDGSGSGEEAEGAAAAGRPGLFDLAVAEKGTLFLDAVSELPLTVQGELLDAIARGGARRSARDGSGSGSGSGSTRARPADVRILASGPPDLKDRIAEGRFREDLFYRLSVISIRLPPLRRRREDIPLLAYHFLQKHARRAGRDMKRISVEALRKLRGEPWPGNVRELEGAIEHAVVMARGDVLMPADLPFEREDEAQEPGRLVVGKLRELGYPEAKERVIDAFDHEYLEGIMKRAAGNISEAARLAGMDRSNFRRLLRKVRGAKAEGGA